MATTLRRVILVITLIGMAVCVPTSNAELRSTMHQRSRMHTPHCCALQALLVCMLLAPLCLGLPSDGGTNAGDSLSQTAYPLLAARVTANQTHFFVYQDADSGFNHGFPSGFFGATHKIDLDTACVDAPSAANGCSADPHRVDRERGTVLRLSFAPLAPGEFAGVNFEEPENFGTLRTGMGYDLRGATHVVFDVRTPAPGGIDVQFGVGGQTTGFFHMPQSSTYTTLSIPLSSLTPSPPDLTNVHLLFTVVTNDLHAPTGGTVLLDNIRFEPVPVSQQNALSFPLSTETFGVVPLRNPDPGRVPLPSDQVLRNLTTTYESALTLLALLARGTEAALRHARVIADAFHYALHHDNHGDPLPVARDGSVGLHNAYASGDVALFNDQTPPAAGRQGDIRLAGFSASPALCGPTGFCLLLDGATGGNNAFAVLALVEAYKRLGDTRYLDDARTIGNWIVAHLTDTTNTGYGGYYLGYPDEGVVPKTLITAKSTENNADIFAAFTALAAVVSDTAEAAAWTARANIAGDFVMAMFDPPTGCFHAGTIPVGTPSGSGIDPTGPHKGHDVINVFPFLDAQTFTTLALAAAPRYQRQLDWRRAVQCGLDRFAQQVTVGAQTFSGFNIVEAPTAGPNGIAWEFTGQAVVAMRVVDRLYQGTRFEADIDLYLDQIRQAQAEAPFADGQGLVASTLQDGGRLPPLEQCLSTPFQCIPQRVGLAATTWAIFADQHVNPLAVCAPCGDVNRDGAVTPGDALLAFQSFLGLTTLTPCQFDVADVNQSGTITPADALEIFKKFLGLENVVEACPTAISSPAALPP